MLRLISIILSALFLSLHAGALLYITSTFLGRFFGPNIISLLYLLAALGNIALFLLAPRLLRYFGTSRLLFLLLLSTLAATLGLAFATSAWSAGLHFVIYASVLFMNYYCLDIFLEEISRDSKTGEIRGLYFTFLNAGIALGPLVVALLAQGDSLLRVYLAGALILIIPLFITLLSWKPKRSEHFSRVVNLPFKQWWRNLDVRRATLAKLALEIFFGVMVIYTPIYLHGTLGFAWSELGVIFTVALLPFVFFEWPIGELADRILGEKEIMTLGFFITGMSLLAMPFMDKGFVAWMFILFASRVGAAFIEITTESYFFKHIDATDTGLLSIFRLSRPGSIIVATTLSVIILQFFSMEKLFFILAAVMLFGLYQSLYLKDTR